MSYFVRVLRNLLKSKQDEAHTEVELKPCLCGKMPRYEFEKTVSKIHATLSCDECGIGTGGVSMEISGLDNLPNPEERLFNEAIARFNQQVAWKRRHMSRTDKANNTLKLLEEKAIEKGLEPR